MEKKAQPSVFYFDFLSPYSYLAFIRWSRLLKSSPRMSPLPSHLSSNLPSPLKSQSDRLDFELCPIFMGGLFQAWGQKGPGEIPPKRDFLLKLLLRLAERHDIPIAPPHHLPFNPLPCLRLAAWCVQALPTQEQKIAALTAIWEAVWVLGIDPEDRELLGDHLQRQGLPGHEWVERSEEKPAKLKLRENMENAIAQGVFGVPTFICFNQDEGKNESENEKDPRDKHSQLYWGNEGLDLLLLEWEEQDREQKRNREERQAKYRGFTALLK